MDKQVAMDSIHGVDLSWLHHSNKADHAKFKKPPPKKDTQQQHSPVASDAPADPPKTQRENIAEAATPLKTGANQTPPPRAPSPQPPQPQQQQQQQPPPSKPLSIKSGLKRPGLKGKPSAEKVTQTGTSPEESKSPSKRPGWITNLSSKFSSSSSTAIPRVDAQANGHAQKSSSGVGQPPPKDEQTPRSKSADLTAGKEDVEPYVPSQPKSGSFLSSAFRRLSTSAPNAAARAPTGACTCPRQVLNVDKERDRCKIDGLNQSKLRRVAFSVDVEIAGVSRYIDEPDSTEPSKKEKDKKIKERSEGEALKNPGLVADQKERKGSAALSPPEGDARERRSSSISVDDMLEAEMLAAAKQQELAAAYQRRQEKIQKRRDDAKANGKDPNDIPISPLSPKSPKSAQSVDLQITRPQDRPTTDPLRMYRRCCQLREAPVLKRISEQLAAAKANDMGSPGVVDTLDLNGSRMQLSDIVCLGDWLAIVPVKRLLVDNANLTDEGVRLILAGLLSAKLPGSYKRKFAKSDPHRLREPYHDRIHGVVEKLSLRANYKITKEGWKHVCVFVNLSRSIKSLDLSMTPYPLPNGTDLKRTQSEKESSSTADITDLFCTSLINRVSHDGFEELMLSDCGLNAQTASMITDAVCKTGISRLGLAKAGLDRDALQHVCNFIGSGRCTGIDLGGNDLSDKLGMIAETLKSKPEFYTLSVADCNLDAESLRPLFPGLVPLTKFRFLDLSHNHKLFSERPDALGILRKWLPQLPYLRRVHLIDTAMSPQQAIGLADILPEIRNLNHISINENPQLAALANAKEPAAQEDACAFYASYMVAARVCKCLVGLDLDPPGAESSEVCQALGKQIFAYALRNMDRYMASDMMKEDDPAGGIENLADPSAGVETPEVLRHLVGPADQEHVAAGEDDLGPDQDWIVGGTGVVKALSYVLGQNAADMRRLSSNLSSPTSPTTTSPSLNNTQAKAMSKNLLGSARRIHARLQPAMAREAQLGNEIDLRRLQLLESTLESMIERFEAEFPECRMNRPLSSTKKTEAAFFHPFHPNPPKPPSIEDEAIEAPLTPTMSRTSASSGDVGSSNTGGEEPPSPDMDLPMQGTNKEPTAADMRGAVFGSTNSRRGSAASLAAKNQVMEEGRMHRLGQRMRREVLPPTGMDDHLHRSSKYDPPEQVHLAQLRDEIETYTGAELRSRVVEHGLEATVQEWAKRALTLKRQSVPDLNLMEGAVSANEEKRNEQ